MVDKTIEAILRWFGKMKRSVDASMRRCKRLTFGNDGH